MSLLRTLTTRRSFPCEGYAFSGAAARSSPQALVIQGRRHFFASAASGETGMSVSSALHAYTNGFWILTIGGVILFLLAPFIQKLMHGVKYVTARATTTTAALGPPFLFPHRGQTTFA